MIIMISIFFITHALQAAEKALPVPMRDPFSFADEMKDPECIGILQAHNTEQMRAIIRYNGKRYTVRVGAIFEGYRVEAITGDEVVVRDNKNKALQLIIS